MTKTAIIFDTETTGFVKAVDTPLDAQPKIIEFFGLKVNEDLEEIGSLGMLIDPKQPLEEVIIKATNITDDMVRGKGAFPMHFRALQEFFLGTSHVIAHNLMFDLDMLMVELKRMGAVNKFPWPPNHICTVEETEHLKGTRLKLIDLHRELTGEGFEDAHRAESDVRATHSVIKVLKARGQFAL